MSERVWLITGVSSGLGGELMKFVASKGDTVAGTVRKESQLKDVNNCVPGKTHGYIMDVNNHAQVSSVVNAILERFGRVDVVANNAGYGLVGAVEETSMTEARDQMETNFFGSLAVTQAVLPAMRAAGSGNILQISSIAGFVGAPGLGLYDASKHALEGMSEALYHELRPLGIHVTIVEPGPFRTKWAGANMKTVAQSIDAYSETAGQMQRNLAKLSGNQPGDPARAAAAMMQVVESEAPPLRLPLGAKAVAAISSKARGVVENVEQWKDASLAADFPS